MSFLPYTTCLVLAISSRLTSHSVFVIKALLQELAYASYLGIHTVILPAPRTRGHVASYARAINTCLKANPYLVLSVRIPIYDPEMIQLPSDPPGTVTGASLKFVDDQPSIATWEMWDAIRTICDYNTRLTLSAYGSSCGFVVREKLTLEWVDIALDMSPPLPAELEVLHQWVAEPTRYLLLPASAFIPNVKGYPVLPKGTQSFIRDIMKVGSICSCTHIEPRLKYTLCRSTHT